MHEHVAATIAVETVAAAARKVAEDFRDRNAWNYNPIECASNDAVASAFEHFADTLRGD